tara:strand:+ start:4535 stop:4924 length:390 start_codon:yes stop_codon:yes gene_type:complete
MFRIYAIVIVVGLVGGVVWGGYTYYKDTQQRISTLTQNNAKLKSANDTNTATIQQLNKNALALNQLIDDLGSELKKAEEYGDELRNTLRKHNLTHLANKKPGMIEKRMQNATDKLWDNLESITSDKPTD